jgi:hypothetical protein
MAASNGNTIRFSGTVDLYRTCPAGVAMLDSLHEMLEDNLLTKEQALLVVTQFDSSIRKVMDKICKKDYAAFTFKADKLDYRLNSSTGVCDAVLHNVRVFKHVESAVVERWMRDRHEMQLFYRGPGEKYQRKYPTEAERMKFKNWYFFFFFYRVRYPNTTDDTLFASIFRRRRKDVGCIVEEVAEMRLSCQKSCYSESEFQELRGHGNPRLTLLVKKTKVESAQTPAVDTESVRLGVCVFFSPFFFSFFYRSVILIYFYRGRITRSASVPSAQAHSCARPASFGSSGPGGSYSARSPCRWSSEREARR